MSPSLDGTLPEYVISQEDNSPLTLYIDFYNFLLFLGIKDIMVPFACNFQDNWWEHLIGIEEDTILENLCEVIRSVGSLFCGVKLTVII